MADMDEKIEAFTGFTGATTAVARHYLQLSDNDAQQAIQLFFDAPELASSIPPEPSTDGPARQTASQIRGTSAGREDDSGVVHIDSDSDDEDVEMDFGQDDDEIIAGQQSTNANSGGNSAYEDDEAMARRLQEEMYAGGGVDADGVRAPIARTTETLVGPNADWTADDMQEAVLQQMNARNRSSR